MSIPVAKKGTSQFIDETNATRQKRKKEEKEKEERKIKFGAIEGISESKSKNINST